MNKAGYYAEIFKKTSRALASCSPLLNQYLLCSTAVILITEFVHLFVANLVVKRHHPVDNTAGGNFYDAVCNGRDEFVVMRVEQHHTREGDERFV